MAQMPLLNDKTPWTQTLCFTGHRPEKLPKGEELAALTRTLHYYIDRAVNLGFTHFFTGLADGVDYLAAAYLFRLREQRPDLKVIGAQPCREYRELFRDMHYNMEHLEYMLQNADSIHVLPNSRDNRTAFLKRNCYMVEHSSGIIAVCADGRSGSMHTFNYAKKEGLAYCRIFPRAKAPYPSPEEWPVELEGF